MTQNFKIAIDGHSSCGKSTLAKRLAVHFGFRYADTGAMYRAVTLYALNQNLIKPETIDTEALKKDIENQKINITFVYNDKTKQSETFLNGKNVEREIRSPRIAAHVSKIASLDFVRTALVKQQQEMGKQGKIVMDGRDICTVVFPDAEVKIFLTAAVDVRAKRRHKELIEKGENISFEEVRKNLEMRDKIDSTRAVSPLIQAEDAVLLNNSKLTLDETVEAALKIVAQSIDSK